MKSYFRTKPFLYVSAGALTLASALVSGATPAPNLHDLMKNIVSVQAQVFWNISSRAMNDDDKPDPSRLSTQDWSQLVSAGTKVSQAAQLLAKADHVMAAAPGQKLQDEDTPNAFNAKAVQKAIDAAPKAFSIFALQLAKTMDQAVAASRAHDAAKLSDAADQIDGICEECHKQFWYPDQKTAG